LHPDANPGIDKTTLTYELSEINAAWQVLSDPKERLRYDRSLQAKEFTQGVETLVGLSIKTAIPFLQKTADTTVAAVDASSKAAQKGAEQAKMAYNVLQLQQASRSMEQKAAAERARAAKLQKEMEALPSKRVASLNTGKNVVLTASEAQRLLKAFQVTSPPFMLETDMKALGKTEQDHKESTRVQQLAERAAEQAERALERAQQAEKQAVQRLEEAQKALVQAQAAHGAAQKAREQATAVKLQSRTELEKTEAALQLTSQKVRTGLQQEQEKYLANQASVLKNEAKQAEGTAKELQVEAERLKKEAQELENSQQQ
jgi:curved DNA-binding protein CbpA